jgi:hypothetical protein
VALGGAGGFFLLQQGTGSPGGSATAGGGQPRPPLDEMRIRFVDIRRPDAGVTSATIPMIVEFRNPADRPIPDISGDFDILVNGQRVGSEELTVNRLEPGEATKVNLDVIVEYADYGSALVDALKAGSFRVSIRGSLNAGGASRTMSVSGQL